MEGGRYCFSYGVVYSLTHMGVFASPACPASGKKIIFAFPVSSTSHAIIRRYLRIAHRCIHSATISSLFAHAAALSPLVLRIPEH